MLDIKGDPFLTVAEIAAYMRVSKMTVYRLVHSGELESHRIGRSFRVRQSVLIAFLKEAGQRNA